MLTEIPLQRFLEELASRKPAPGGGSTAALVGSLAAALVEMVSRLTDSDRMGEICAAAGTVRNQLTKLIDEDAEAFTAFMNAPKNEKEKALKHTATVPLETVELSYRVLEMAGETARKGNQNALTDAAVAALLANAAVQGAILNVRINIGSIRDMEFNRTVGEKLERLSNCQEQSQIIVDYIREQL